MTSKFVAPDVELYLQEIDKAVSAKDAARLKTIVQDMKNYRDNLDTIIDMTLRLAKSYEKETV